MNVGDQAAIEFSRQAGSLSGTCGSSGFSLVKVPQPDLSRVLNDIIDRLDRIEKKLEKA